MSAGSLWFILEILPLLVLTAVIFGWFGWSLRRRFHPPAASSHKTPAVQDDLPARERIKKLENALSKAEAARKTAQDDLAASQAKSIAKSAHEKVTKELTEVHLKLEGDQKRIQALEAELKRSRDTVSTLNSKASDANKSQQERLFALENELSKARGDLATLQAKPDTSLELQKEVDRLRDALSNSTRVVGELRKQEAAAVAALEKIQKKAALPAAAVTLVAEPSVDKVLDLTGDAKAALERIEAAAENAAAEKAAAEKAAAEKAAAEKAAAEAAAAEAAAAEKAAAENAAAEKAVVPPVQSDLFPVTPPPSNNSPA